MTHADTVTLNHLSTARQYRDAWPPNPAQGRGVLLTYFYLGRSYFLTYLPTLTSSTYLLTCLLACLPHSFDLARYYLHSTRHDLAAISTLLQAGAKGLGSRLVCGS